MKLEVYSQRHDLTSLAVLNEQHEVVATLEVYDEGKEVFASTGREGSRRSITAREDAPEKVEQPAQSRPAHPPTEIVLRVDGPGFPGFPPDTIKVEPQYGTFELLRDGTKLASGALAGAAGVPS